MRVLLFCAREIRIAKIGIERKNCGDSNIQIELDGGKLHLSIDGQMESLANNEAMTKERLAAKSVKHVTLLGDDYFSIGFDLQLSNFTLTHMGVDVNKLPRSSTATDGP